MKRYIWINSVVVFIMLSVSIILPGENYIGLIGRIMLFLSFELFAIWVILIIIYGRVDDRVFKKCVFGICAAAVLVLGIFKLPELKDLFGEHAFKKGDPSVFRVTEKRYAKRTNRYYILDNSGNRYEISFNTYSEIRNSDCKYLNLEYFPNTLMAVKVSMENDE